MHQSWGTKWNTCDFIGRMIDGMIYDCVFDTAWSCPEPALRELAAKYPALSGTIVSCDPADDWCLIGTIQHGFYSSSASAYDPQIDLLMWAGYQEMAYPGALIHALIESVSGERAGEASRDMAVPERRRTIFAALDQRLTHSLCRRFYFERSALDVLALLERPAKAFGTSVSAISCSIREAQRTSRSSSGTTACVLRSTANC